MTYTPVMKIYGIPYISYMYLQGQNEIDKVFSNNWFPRNILYRCFCESRQKKIDQSINGFHLQKSSFISTESYQYFY